MASNGDSPRSPTGRSSDPSVVSAELARLSGLTGDFYGDEKKGGGMAPAVTFGKRKTIAKAYLLWVLTMGSTGQHRFYCGAPITAAMQVVLMVLSLTALAKPPEGIKLPDGGSHIAESAGPSIADAMPPGVAKWSAIILTLWAGVDLFLIPRMVRKYNADMFDDYKPPAPRYDRVHAVSETALRSAPLPIPKTVTHEKEGDDWMNRPPDRF